MPSFPSGNAAHTVGEKRESVNRGVYLGSPGLHAVLWLWARSGLSESWLRLRRFSWKRFIPQCLRPLWGRCS